jgi:hypothetical protein
MNLLRTSSIVAITAVVLCITSAAQAQRGRTSPHDTISAVIDGNRVTIVYGRPYSKAPRGEEIRKIWGGLVPWDKVWRLGADEATLMITQQPLQIGEATIPAGAYTLFMLPQETAASKLIFNKQLGQWGLQYDEKQDLVRVDMKKDAVDPQVDQLAIAVERNPAGGGLLKVTWEKTQYSVAFTVKK